MGQDTRGQATLEAMHTLSLLTIFLETVQDFPACTTVVSTSPGGETYFVIDRPAAFDAFHLSPVALAQLVALKPDWIYMGTLLQTAPTMEHLLQTIRRQLPNARYFYDMNLREGHWNLALVERLCEGVSILKLNELEAATLNSLNGGGEGDFTLEGYCRERSARLGIRIICVT